MISVLVNRYSHVQKRNVISGWGRGRGCIMCTWNDCLMFVDGHCLENKPALLYCVALWWQRQAGGVGIVILKA